MCFLRPSSFANTRRKPRRKLIKAICLQIQNNSSSTSLDENTHQVFLDFLTSLSDESLSRFTVLTSSKFDIALPKLEFKNSQISINNPNSQYSCITIDPKLFHDRKSQLRKRPFSCLEAFKKPNPKFEEKKVENDPTDRVFCWLALVFHLFRRHEMSPDSLFKPNPCCHVQRTRSAEHESDVCCPNYESEPIFIPKSNISTICFNPTHWSLINQPRTTRSTGSEFSSLSTSETREAVSTGCANNSGAMGVAEYHGPVPYPAVDHSIPACAANNNDSAIPFKRWCYYQWENSASFTWAKLALWEKRTRLGAMQNLCKNNVIISSSKQYSSEIPANENFDQILLDEVVSQSNSSENWPMGSKDANISHTFHQIVATGAIISHCSNGEVWLFNQDDRPVFVMSPTLNFDPENNQTPVLRLDPGTCSRIFNPEVFPLYRKVAQHQPVDPYSIKVSFAKGFGPGYTRSQVSSCPCWVEILLNIDRSS